MENDDDLRTILDRASELLQAGRPDETLRCLDAIEPESMDGDDRVECVSLRAWALSELGRHDESLELLEPLVEEFPESARLRCAMGVVLSNAGNLEEACGALEAAVELDGEDPITLTGLGLVYERLREFDRARELYDRAMECGAEIDWLLPRKAVVQLELGEAAAAASTLRRYLCLVPDDGEQWMHLAILNGDLQQFDAAFECYRTAERLVPDLPALRLNWGVTAVRAGDLEEARRQLAQLRRLEPDSLRPVLLRALLAEAEGSVVAAARGYREVLSRAEQAEEAERVYAMEMAMDFYSRQRRVLQCERLIHRAYRANACTVELCEAYRQAVGERLERATWYSLILEADYRDGLCEVQDRSERSARSNGLYTRFQRNYQVIARDHDSAIALAMEFAQRMGESHIAMREFVNEEAMADAYSGVYEVERDSLVFADDGAGEE